MDKADGSGTILFDLKARNWSKPVLDKLEIPAEWLPPTFEGPEMTGRVSAGAAAETGLAAGTPVVAGGGDQAAGAVGAGAVRPGVVSLTLGTSGVVFATTDAPLVEPEGRLHAFCHAVPGRWHFMGVTLSAAGSLQWYRDTLTPSESFAADRDRGRVGAGRQRGPAVPALPLRRAHALPRPARAGRLRRPDPAPPAGAPDARRARGRRLLDEGLLRPAAGRRSRLGERGADRRRRRQGRAVAEDRRERARPADGHGQQHRGRGVRGGAARRRRGRARGRASRRRATRRSRSPAATSRTPRGRAPTASSTRATASCTRRCGRRSSASLPEAQAGPLRALARRGVGCRGSARSRPSARGAGRASG